MRFAAGLCHSEDTAYEQYGSQIQPLCFQWRNLVFAGGQSLILVLLVEFVFHVAECDYCMVRLKS
ncbi:MAG: hypothetical protein CMA88_01930 [Euryarchaeota archaeon]|nr:hypothetical protein [Euryarchaeota archaeon]